MLRKKGKPDPTPARAEKRTASRYYQLKSGHALRGVYLKSTDNRPDDHCWWCDPDNNCGMQQTRDHLFKHCSRCKDQHKKTKKTKAKCEYDQTKKKSMNKKKPHRKSYSTPSSLSEPSVICGNLHDNKLFRAENANYERQTR